MKSDLIALTKKNRLPYQLGVGPGRQRLDTCASDVSERTDNVVVKPKFLHGHCYELRNRMSDSYYNIIYVYS